MATTISILLPTRKRERGLRDAVESLYRLAARPEDLELVLRVDDDDPLDYQSYRARERTVVLGGPRHHYIGMHHYYDECSRAAAGEWLLVWNDDEVMLTERWDEKLLARRQGLHVQFLKRDTYGPQDPKDVYQNIDTACPAYPKKLFELLGHVSLNAHCDSWLDYVSEACGIKTFRHDIVYHHDRPNDETATERVFDWEAFQRSDMAAGRARDIELVQQFLQDHPEERP